MSREIPQPVVAHHNAKFNYSCQFFMFGPPSHAFDSFPVVCFILVFLKISLNFAVKYSVGVRYIFCSETTRQHLQHCLFANLVRILQPSRPVMNSTFPVALFFSYLVKFHFCCELTYVSFWEAFLNSERAFFGCEGRFFSLWCPQPLYKIYLYTYFNRGCFGNRALVFESNSLVVTQAKDCIVLCVSMTKSKSNLY